jgi:hypothetical protein
MVGNMDDDERHAEASVTADEPGPAAVAFGARVRTLRGERSLKAFAAELGGVSAGHLCEVENGKARPSRRLVERLDEVGATSGATRFERLYPELLNEWGARKWARAARRRQVAEELRQRASALDEASRGSAAGGASTGSTAIGEDAVNRREAVKTIGALLLGGATRARGLLRSAESSNVGPLTLDEYDEVVETLTRTAHIRPVVPLMAKADQVAAEIAELLKGKQSGRQRTHLERLTGQLAYLQGDFAFRLGNYQVARTHLRLARHYGDQLGDHLLLASAANVETYVALYAGRFDEALTTVREARRYASEHTAARLATLEARALAGAEPTAHKELTVLWDQAEAAAPARLPWQSGSVAPFGPEQFAFHAAAASVRASHPRGEEFAREALRQYEALAAVEGERFLHAHLALSRLDLATALVQSKRPEPREAARLGIQALAVPQQLHEDTVKRRAVELLAVLNTHTAWRSLPSVTEFADRARTYRPAALPPPPRSLPGR